MPLILTRCTVPPSTSWRAAGADALVVGSPYYFGVGAADQQRHVEAVLQSAALPVLLYNIPQSTHVPLHPDAVASLSSERRVLGIKDSWGDMPYFQSMLTLKLRRDRKSTRLNSSHEWISYAVFCL